MRNILLPSFLLLCLLFSCGSGAERLKQGWLPFYTADADGSGTEIIKISPDNPNRLYYYLDREYLGRIYRGDKTLYAFTSSPNGGLYVEIVPADGSRRSVPVPLPFSASDLKLTAAAWTPDGNLAVAFTGASGISLLILDPAGTLLDRQMLPDFLLGPATDYKLGKTALSTCRITRIEAANDGVLVLCGTAELFEGQPRVWEVRYRTGTEVFLESRLVD